MSSVDAGGLASRSAREAMAALATQVELLDLGAVSRDPLGWPGYQEQLARARRLSGEPESVLVACARLGDTDVVLVALDFRFMGGSMGEAAGERIVAAFSEAQRRRVPIVSLVSTGGARMQEGMPALVQMQRIARACATARAYGIPHLAVLRHPTTGGIWASLAADADIVLALPEAIVAFAGPRVRTATGAAHDGRPFTAEGKQEDGFVDHVLEEEHLRDAVALAARLLAPRSRGALRPAAVPRALGLRDPARAPRGWQSVVSARAPGRPRAEAYLDDYFAARVGIRGDRCGGVDDGMLCGFGLRDGRTVAYAAQNGTATTPAGFRTATRLIRLAERFDLPVLTLIDTPGAANGVEAEREGVGTAIAELLQTVASCRVPVTSLVVGEGGSGGALALAHPDRLWIVPDGYFAVIAPEGAAAILERDTSRAPALADRMALAPADLVDLGIVAGIASAQHADAA